MCKKVLVFVFVLSMTLLSLSGCAQTIVRPPVRMGERIVDNCYMYGFTNLTEAYEMVDVVARVRIGNWLGEETGGYVTFFEAEVVEQYKGESLDSFILIQDGSSELTPKGYPLFTYGDELLLFLLTSTGFNRVTGRNPEAYPLDQITTLSTGKQVKEGDCYYICTSERGSFDIVTSDTGASYILDRYHLAETLGLTNYGESAAVRKTISEDLCSRMEKEVREAKYDTDIYENVYSLKEVVGVLKK